MNLETQTITLIYNINTFSFTFVLFPKNMYNKESETEYVMSKSYFL
jgi:hypothetical protein